MVRDFFKNSPRKSVLDFLKVCRCCNSKVLSRDQPVDIFGNETSVELGEILVHESNQSVSPEHLYLEPRPRRLRETGGFGVENEWKYQELKFGR